MEMQPVSTIESRSPGLKIGTCIVIYGTGQATNGVQSEQVFLGVFWHGNRAAGGLDVSNCGHPRPLHVGQSGIFENPLWGFMLVMRYNFITCNRSLVETSISDSKDIHLPRTIRVKI